jgi:preprotein translocase subunit SecE
MEDVKKWLALVYLIFAMTAWYLSTAFIKWVANYFMLMEKYSWSGLLIYGLPLVLGIIVYVLCYRLEQVNVYMSEVVAEIKKVVWPTRKETWAATIVVLIAVLISGAMLGVFDWLSASLLRYILK